MKVVRDDAWTLFMRAPEHPAFKGERVKSRRSEEVRPGGRCRMTLFEAGDDEQRAHPRLRVSLPDAEDPSPLTALPQAVEGAPPDAGSFLVWAKAQRDAAGFQLQVQDLDPSAAPKGSERWWRNSIRAQRCAALFGLLRAQLQRWLDEGALPADQRAPALYGLRELESDTFSGEINFDNSDTGTYHAYEHDKPFVHFLEAMLAGLPEEGGEAFALLSPEQQHSVRRQRRQARAHLDHLMRHKYANTRITETDIERGLGGLLIDRLTRLIVSEDPSTLSTLTPRYELLRVDPGASHPQAGAWVYRDAGMICTQAGELVEVDEALLRRTPVPTEQLTFQRALGDRRLRADLRFDWDGDGWVRRGDVEWVSWAGHCDIKAVLESIGATLMGMPAPSLTEYRSDTDQTQVWTRDLLLEMLASSFELGSRYTRLDGSGVISLGTHNFGGARNDSRPDRLQLQGVASGQGFRWPLSQRQEVMTVIGLEQDGQAVDVATAFMRDIPDLEKVDFAPNPRYLKTVEGDYNVIDVSGMRIVAKVRMDTIDEATGYPDRREEQLSIDLGPGGANEVIWLGTSLKDAARRELWDLQLDRPNNQIIARVLRHDRGADGRFVPQEMSALTQRIRLNRPLTATLSREMKEDDPQLFQALVHLAVRKAQNICADTDAKAEVWNGVVTQLRSERLGVNREQRVERWRISVVARFGRASLEYLVRLDEEGRALAWCAVPSAKGLDFLWQDLPDVGSKAKIGPDWAINQTMLQRKIVELERNPSAEGGIFVADDQVKHVFELLWTALSEHRFSVLHDNKRYAFRSEEDWRRAVDDLKALRAGLRFEA